MMKHFVVVNNIGHYFNEMTFHQDTNATRLRTCALCRNLLQKGNQIYLIVNNNIVFPNVFVHKECSDKYGMEKTIRMLIRDYQVACFFKHWFF
jgi:hypothetical protein